MNKDEIEKLARSLSPCAMCAAMGRKIRLMECGCEDSALCYRCHGVGAEPGAVSKLTEAISAAHAAGREAGLREAEGVCARVELWHTVKTALGEQPFAGLGSGCLIATRECIRAIRKLRESSDG